MSKTIKVIVIDGAEEAREIITPQSGGNQYDGTAADEMVVAGDADDRIHGGGGDDIIFGGAGNDVLHGDAGDDIVSGGSGNDALRGGDGADWLRGQDGNDHLYGDAGDDTLDGGAGNDMLDGGSGNDTYLFGIGSGQDIISAFEDRAGKRDVIQLGAGITVADIVLSREWQSLQLSIKGSTDSLRVNDYFYGDASHGCQAEQIRFADGTIWDVEMVRQMVTTGTAGDDVLYGYAGADTLAGLAGNDMLDGKGRQ